MNRIYKSLIFSFLFSCVLPISLNAQFSSGEYLYYRIVPTLNVRPINIKDVVYKIRPKGNTYAEVSLNMTYSAQGLSPWITNPLEILHNFILPEDVTVTDSWLWIDSTIIYAHLIDRWKAERIYNSVLPPTQYERDPSFLTKNSATNYAFRIYPLKSDSSRRVQLTFHIPYKWNSGKPYVQLPTNLLKGSPVKPSIKVVQYLNSDWRMPYFLNETSPTNWVAGVDSTTGENTRTALFASNIVQNIPIKISNTQVLEGVKIKTVTHNGENFYELAYRTNDTLSNNAPVRKLTFVLGHNYNSALDFYTVYSYLKNIIRAKIENTRDSFTIILPDPYDFSTRYYSYAELDSILNLTPSYNQIGYNFRELLEKSLHFMIRHNGTEIVFFSNNKSITSEFASNLYYYTLISTQNPLPRFSFFNYCNDCDYWFSNGNIYWGNNILYNTLANTTNGICVTNSHLQNPQNLYDNIQNFIDSVVTDNQPFVNSINIIPTNGSIYNVFNTDNSINIGIPKIQYGRYTGHPPFTVIVSESHNGQVFTNQFIVNEAQIGTVDSTLSQVCIGKQIALWESGIETEANIRRIVNISMRNIVLSRYTAFLAPEPSLGGDSCITCRNTSQSGGQTANKDLETATKIGLEAYPNPFSSQIVFKTTFPEWQQGDKNELIIYNLMGQLVYKIDLELKNGDTVKEVYWEAKDLPQGVYIVQINVGKNQKLLKVLKKE